MRTALSYIDDKKETFARLPFFQYLRDRTRSAKERFSFTPAVAPFVMAFSDLNKYALYTPDPKRPLERLINVHSEEDATHFEMYLSDLVVLGFDVPIKLSNALRFLWADESKCSRQTCYALAAMLEAAPLNLRLVIVEAIESAGAAAFETLAALAEEYAGATGTKLQFFGARHKALETGHALGTEDIERDLNAVVLAACEREQARQLVDRVFCVFSAMMQELHEYGVGVNSGSKAGLRRTTHG